MKHILEPGTPHPADPKRNFGDRRLAANIPVLPRIGGRLRGGGESEPRITEVARWPVPRLAAWLVAMAVCACFTGCLGFLEPARPIARHFVLTPLPGAGAGEGDARRFGCGRGPD